jgi:hypothetical protein
MPPRTAIRNPPGQRKRAIIVDAKIALRLLSGSGVGSSGSGSGARSGSVQRGQAEEMLSPRKGLLQYWHLLRGRRG